MLLVYLRRLSLCGRLRLHARKLENGVPVALCVVHDGSGVIFAHTAAALLLQRSRHLVRLCDEFRGHPFELGAPRADKDVVDSCVVVGLLGRVIDAVGIDAGRTRLHLELGVVDPWLIVQKESGHCRSESPPVEPQLVGSKRHEHATHAKVEPTGVLERTHARIDHREARFAVQPRLVLGLIKVGAQRIVRAHHVHGLNGWLIVQLLCKVRAPSQPRAVCCEALEPAARLLPGLLLPPDGLLPPAQLVKDGAQRHVTPCEVGAEPRA
mmetsp:Transcript_11401/g.29207  ORF Transcript_11401/g.29207 Transcript_11401/m.29207 type:complete len:267 (+) Transcript_11401:992-1792(+)